MAVWLHLKKKKKKSLMRHEGQRLHPPDHASSQINLCKSFWKIFMTQFYLIFKWHFFISFSQCLRRRFSLSLSFSLFCYISCSLPIVSPLSLITFITPPPQSRPAPHWRRQSGCHSNHSPPSQPGLYHSLSAFRDAARIPVSQSMKTLHGNTKGRGELKTQEPRVI